MDCDYGHVQMGAVVSKRCASNKGFEPHARVTAEPNMVYTLEFSTNILSKKSVQEKLRTSLFWYNLLESIMLDSIIDSLSEADHTLSKHIPQVLDIKIEFDHSPMHISGTVSWRSIRVNDDALAMSIGYHLEDSFKICGRSSKCYPGVLEWNHVKN